MAAKKPGTSATSGDFDSLVTYPHNWESATPNSQMVMTATCAKPWSFQEKRFIIQIGKEVGS